MKSGSTGANANMSSKAQAKDPTTTPKFSSQTAVGSTSGDNLEINQISKKSKNKTQRKLPRHPALDSDSSLTTLESLEGTSLATEPMPKLSLGQEIRLGFMGASGDYEMANRYVRERSKGDALRSAGRVSRAQENWKMSKNTQRTDITSVWPPKIICCGFFWATGHYEMWAKQVENLFTRGGRHALLFEPGESELSVPARKEAKTAPAESLDEIRRKQLELESIVIAEHASRKLRKKSRKGTKKKDEVEENDKEEAASVTNETKLKRETSRERQNDDFNEKLDKLRHERPTAVVNDPRKERTKQRRKDTEFDEDRKGINQENEPKEQKSRNKIPRKSISEEPKSIVTTTPRESKPKVHRGRTKSIRKEDKKGSNAQENEPKGEKRRKKSSKSISEEPEPPVGFLVPTPDESKSKTRSSRTKSTKKESRKGDDDQENEPEEQMSRKKSRKSIREEPAAAPVVGFQAPPSPEESEKPKPHRGRTKSTKNTRIAPSNPDIEPEMPKVYPSKSSTKRSAVSNGELSTHRLFIKNIPSQAEQKDLEKIFPGGNIQWSKGESRKRTAIVEYKDDENAFKAFNKGRDSVLYDQPLVVTPMIRN